MVAMKNWATQAIQKLEGDRKNVKGRKEGVMAGAVLAAIKDFCIQDDEFAQAVVQGGSFADCMKKVADGTGESISDLDAYKKAVQFFFPGAEVKMQLTIDLVGAAGEDAEEPKQYANTAEQQKVISLDLADFFG